MKKIIVTLMLIILFSSCGNKKIDIENENSTWAIIDDLSVSIDEQNNTGSSDEINFENNDLLNDNSNEQNSLNWNVIIKNDTSNIEKSDKETIENKKIQVNNNDEALEAEVNDLLDDFINSLDNYDN